MDLINKEDQDKQKQAPILIEDRIKNLFNQPSLLEISNNNSTEKTFQLDNDTTVHMGIRG